MKKPLLWLTLTIVLMCAHSLAGLSNEWAVYFYEKDGTSKVTYYVNKNCTLDYSDQWGYTVVFSTRTVTDYLLPLKRDDVQDGKPRIKAKVTEKKGRITDVTLLYSRVVLNRWYPISGGDIAYELISKFNSGAIGFNLKPNW